MRRSVLGLDSEQQAKFFNYLSQVATDDYKRGMQFAYIRDEPDLTEHAKDFIREMYLYMEDKR